MPLLHTNSVDCGAAATHATVGYNGLFTIQHFFYTFSSKLYKIKENVSYTNRTNFNPNYRINIQGGGQREWEEEKTNPFSTRPLDYLD